MKRTAQGDVYLRIRQDVNVYQIEDRTLVFRRGPAALRLESEALARQSKEFLNALEEWIPIDQVTDRLGIRDNVDIDAVLGALVNGGYVMLDVRANGQGQEVSAAGILDTFNGNGLFPAAMIRQALKEFGVYVSGPDWFAESVQAALKEYDIASLRTDLKAEGSGMTSLALPETKTWRDELHVLYFRDVDQAGRKWLTYELVRRNVHWLPIHSDGPTPCVVGPVVAEEGPCLQCYETRRLGNLDRPEVLSLVASSNARLIRRGQTTMSPIEMRLVLGALVSLVMMYVLGQHTQQNSRKATFFRVDEVSSRVERKVVYKNPYCEACGPATLVPGGRDFS